MKHPLLFLPLAALPMLPLRSAMRAPQPAVLATSAHSGPPALDFGAATLPAGITEEPPNSDNFVVDLAHPAFAADYDAVEWAIDTQWASITLPPNHVVRFLNHPSRAPVVWRSLGGVNISGELILDGESALGPASGTRYPEPGPGGFRGGRGKNEGEITGASSGFGPGGAALASFPPGDGQPAAHSQRGVDNFGTEYSRTYGSPEISGLMGGSGGSGQHSTNSNQREEGGAGGGALLLQSDTQVTVSGRILARGGNGYFDSFNRSGPGSGGAIRIVAPIVTVTSQAELNTGGRSVGALTSSPGYVRIEADGRSGLMVHPDATIVPETVHTYSDTLGDIFDTSRPRVAITAWLDGASWVPITADPRAAFLPAQDADVDVGTPGVRWFRVEATNVDTSWRVELRLVHTRGGETLYSDIPLLAGPPGEHYAEVSIDLSGGVSSLQARAHPQ